MACGMLPRAVWGLEPAYIERGAGKVWQRMVDSLMEGASLQPLIVINGTPVCCGTTVAVAKAKR